MLLSFWAVALYLGVLGGLFAGRRLDAWDDRGAALGIAMAVLGVMGALAGLWLWRRRLRAVAIFASLLVAGVGWGAWSGRVPAYPGAIAQALSEQGSEVWVEGRWIRTLKAPSLAASGRGLLASSSIAGVSFEARVALSVPGATRLPRPGDRVRLRARLSVPMGLANPDMPDARWSALAQGIDLLGVAARAGAIETSAPARWDPRRWAEDAHHAMAAAIDRDVAGIQGPLLKALVLGERSAAGPDVEAGFKAAGAVHALSVSGLHLTAIAAALFFLLRRSLLWFPRFALNRNPDVVAAALSIPAVVFYCAITGEAVATRRSALMAALALGAVVVGRLPSLPGAIGAAALALLIDSPLLVIDPSFQLSFASVAALAVVSGRWQSRPDEPWWRRALVWVGRGLLVSLAAFVVTAPLAAHHFGELAPASPVGNLLLVPPVEAGIVPLGLFGAALGAVWRPLGYVPLALAEGIAGIVLVLAERFRRHAPVWPVASPDGFETATLFIAALLALVATGMVQGRRRLLGIFAAVAALTGGGHLAFRALAARHRDGVLITFLDVGQGDAALIEGPDGFVALIDGGGNVDGSFDPGARVIEPVLRRKTIGHIDLLVMSHPHPDHMNGLFRIVERFSVGTFWASGDGTGQAAFDRLTTSLRAQGVFFATATEHRDAGLVFRALGPFVGDQIAPPPGLEANDASLVLGLEFAGRRVLFSGDIEAQGEAELLGRHTAAALKSDVLKVPHHASRTSSSDELLAQVAPALAIASLGFRNRFGFPRAEVVERYRDRGIALLRTDRSGALTVEITRDGVLRTTCIRSCR